MSLSRDRQNGSTPIYKKLNLALLVLRAGLGLSLVFLFGLRQSESAAVFAYHRDYIWPLVALALPMCLVVCGYLTKPAAFIATLIWIWALYNGLQAGQAWYSHPIRAALYAIICAAIALAGAGKYSLEHALQVQSLRHQRRSETS